MSNTSNYYLFKHPSTSQEPSELVTESSELVFQLGLPSPEFLPNTITKPDGEPIEDVNVIDDNANHAPSNDNYELPLQIVFPTMREFLLKDEFFNVVVPSHKPKKQATLSTPSQSDSSPVQTESALPQIPSQSDLPIELIGEILAQAQPSIVSKQHIPYIQDLPLEEKQDAEYALLKQATSIALHINPEITTMEEYYDLLPISIQNVIETVISNAPEGLPSRRGQILIGPSIEDFVESHLFENEDDTDQPPPIEPSFFALKQTSKPWDQELPDTTLVDLVDKPDYPRQHYTIKTRQIKNKRQIEFARLIRKANKQDSSGNQYKVRGVRPIKKYMNRLKGLILSRYKVSTIIDAIDAFVNSKPVYHFSAQQYTEFYHKPVSKFTSKKNHKPVSHYTAEQHTEIGKYLRDIISLEVKKIEREDHILSKRVSRSRGSDDILPLLIQDIANSAKEYTNTREYGTPFEEYLRKIMISEEIKGEEADGTILGRIREFIKFEDNKVSYTERIRELIKIKDEKVYQDHMGNIAYLMELTSGLQEYFPSVSNNLQDLPDLQRRLSGSYKKRISAIDFDADAPKSKYQREHRNRDGPIKDPRERTYKPLDPTLAKPTVNIEFLPAENKPVVMKDPLLTF